MKKVFLIAGLGCILVAIALYLIKRSPGPTAPGRVWESRKESHKAITSPKFSPDGEKLIFLVNDESRRYHETETYLYSLSDRTIRRLKTNEDGCVSSGFAWAPDSTHVGFSWSDSSRGYRGTGRIFNVEANAFEEEFKLPIHLLSWSPDGKKQVFKDFNFGTYHIKETGSSKWIQMPNHVKSRDFLRWSRDGRYLYYCEPLLDSIMQYDIEMDTLEPLVEMGEKDISALLHPSRHSDSLYFLTSRGSEGVSWPVIIWKVDLQTGKVGQVFDTGFQPEERIYIWAFGVFLGPDDDYLYYVQIDKPNNRRTLINLNTSTKETEALLEGEHKIWDYSPLRQLFALTSPEDDHRTLSLFDPATLALERIFPPD